MPKRISPSSALARLPKDELVRTYVWEKPVRIAHWLMFFAIVFLAFTGLYMHRPFVLSSGRGAFVMARMRFIHVVSGFVLIAAFALRVYWFFRGNFWSRWTAYVPIHRQQWLGIRDMLEFYLFMRFEPGRRTGHNPLAALSYFFIYLLIAVEIVTGLVLYSRVVGNRVLLQATTWLALAIDPSYLRLTHYFLTFVFFAFVIFHVYASVLVSLEEENGLLDSIFSGWKFMPAGALRREIADIPEARKFAKHHELLPKGTAQETRAGEIPKRRPGPGPVALYRNWISYAGTAVAAIGALVFVVLTAYHTIGGRALVEPYGDLVIFFVPPVFVFGGIALVLVGMYWQWILWRMHKPLSFARYPKWDLNLATERKALLIVGIGTAILAVPAIYGSGQAYVYTDATPFCGSVCHSMNPEFVSYQRSPHAHVGCAQCHVAPGPMGYLTAKMRGMTELAETIENDYPKPIPIPVTALYPIRSNCEECHWPANSFGTKQVHRVHFLADEHNTRWNIDMSVQIGGGAQAGIHWHVATKVEYVASDAEHQNIAWVRYVDPATGQAKVFTSSEQQYTQPVSGEIRTMDCVDCHNRPSHILPAPAESVDQAIAGGRIDPSLPFIKQQSVAALTGNYKDQQTAMQGIDATLRGYYQKGYPQLYVEKRQAIGSAVSELQDTYGRSFFPSMKVRWDTYAANDSHLISNGCYRCHDGKHKSIDGAVIRSDCNTCHTITGQGQAGAEKFATDNKGLKFEHPVEIGDIWSQQACSSCHTGGPL